MKTVLLHGLGQTAQDWKEVVQQLSISDVDCPELFSSAEDEISYSDRKKRRVGKECRSRWSPYH